MLSETGIEVDLVEGEPAGTLPDVAANPKDKNDGQGKALHEEVGGISVAVGVVRANGDKELGCQDHNAETKSHPGASDTTNSLEGDIVERAALVGPGASEADVGLENKLETRHWSEAVD